ncbi:MAG: DNA internalization-related competence protein ComEC/Rec2, partial [Defluviitaleaceae bacterium]|nr:DNA internalization-related competence protein ComEC/Rec2 [Defluviitaleaceae bacterium]
FLYFVLFLAAGIVYARLVYPLAGFLWLVIGVLAASLGLYFLNKSKLCVVLPLFAVIGFFILQNAVMDTSPLLHNLAAAREEVEFTGVVVSTSFTAAGRTTAVVQSEEFKFQISEDVLRYVESVNILLFLGVGEEVPIGAEVTVRGNLQALRFRQNPGAFDEFTFRRTRGIEYTMFPNEFTIDGVNTGFNLTALTSQAANALRDSIYNVLPPLEAGILTGMLLGDRRGISGEDRDMFREAGIFHIFAVSGMHVSIVALFMSGLLEKFGLNRRKAGLVSLAFIIFYCLMTGASPGTVRAVIMAGSYIFGRLIWRRGDGLNSLAIAAMLILLHQPLFIWDIGFQFSFLVVTGLIILSPKIQMLILHFTRKNKGLKRATEIRVIANHLPAVLAASLVSIPIYAFYFYQFPLLGFLANLIILPTLALTVVAGFLVGLVGLVSTGVASLFAVVPQALIQFYYAISEWFGGIPFNTVFTGQPRFTIVLLYAVTLLIISYRKSRGKAAKLAVSVLGLGLVISAAIPAPLTVTLLYVGQGDAVIISHGGRAILIDGGGRGMDRVGQDTGVNIIMPYLNHLGIRTLDAIFISHSHWDHAIGALEVLQAGRAERLFLSPLDNADPEILAALISAAEANGTSIIYTGTGDIQRFWDVVTVNVLYPPSTTAFSGNDNSMVLMVEADGVRFLFTGDIEAAAEREILFMFGQYPIRADVLMLAHHGSRTSSTQSFLDAVSPRVAVNSAGRHNPFGHPHIDVVTRLYDMGIPLFSTSNSGAIRLFPNNNNLRIVTMEDFSDERTEQPLKIR